MHMVHALAAVAVAIGDHSKSTFGYALAARQLGRDAIGRTDQLFFSRRNFENRLDVLVWDDEKMHRGRRVDILDRKEAAVIVDFFGRNLSRSDLAKQAL